MTNNLSEKEGSEKKGFPVSLTKFKGAGRDYLNAMDTSVSNNSSRWDVLYFHRMP